MSKQATTVKIYWPDSHHRDDDDIGYQLEAGGDEGPLLVISAQQPIDARSHKVVGVFKNLDWYLSSLAYGDDADLPGERWVGLVRGSDRNNGDAAVSALQRLAQNLSVRRASRGIRREPVRSVPEGALTEPVDFDGLILIENAGEGFDNVARAYPALLPKMSV